MHKLFFLGDQEIRLWWIHCTSAKKHLKLKLQNGQFFGDCIVQILLLQQNQFQAWSPVWGGGGGVPSRKYQKEQGLQTWEQQPGAFLTQFCRTKDRPIEFWYLVPGKSTKIISGNIKRGAGSNNLRRNIINKCLPLFVAYNVCLIVWRSSNLLLYIFRYTSWQEEHQATT